MTLQPAAFVLVVSLQPLDATTTLFFGGLLGVSPGAIRVVQYGRDDVARFLGAASAVVLVRGLFEFGGLIRCARALRIPLYYFVDDNFVVLRAQGGEGAAFVSRYSAESVRAALRPFSGVLLATPALVNFYSDQQLHPSLSLFPPTMVSLDAPAEPGAERSSAHVAFFGGRHLHHMLLNTVLPALRRVAQQRPLTLLAVGVPQSIEPSAGLSIVQQPYDESYLGGLGKLAATRVDLLLHPVARGVANNSYKNPHALITARALGAVAVVSNAPPYDSLPAGVAVLCDDTEESWYRGLLQAVTETSAPALEHARLGRYCAEHFDGTLNREIVNRLLREHRRPRRSVAVVRHGIASVCLMADRAGRIVSSLARRVRPRIAAAAA